MERSVIKQGFLLICLILCLLPGCSHQGFNVKNLAKSDIDFVTDASYKMCDQRLRALTEKLYKRNPRELRKGLIQSPEARITQLFGTQGALSFLELDGRSGIAAMNAALDENYNGDRVFALMTGLTDMLRNAYGYKSDFYILDNLDQDKLYKSARNVEIFAWKLSNSYNSAGHLLLLSNGLSGEPKNLSYERLFGELIAIQDLMAKIMSQKNDRVINMVTINMASLVFFPL